MKVIANYHDDTDFIGLSVVECIGTSFDKRNLSLYRLENGWLGWLPDSVIETNERKENDTQGTPGIE